jgi:hypothetical protein
MQCPATKPWLMMPELIILSPTHLLFMSSWHTNPSTTEIIFYCTGQRISYTVTHTLQYVVLGSHCQFSVPLDATINQCRLSSTDADLLYLNVQLQTTQAKEDADVSFKHQRLHAHHARK